MRQGEGLRGSDRKEGEHLCYLFCPEIDIAFVMQVSKEGEDICCGPVRATGEGYLSEETRFKVEGWARSEALRVYDLQ